MCTRKVTKIIVALILTVGLLGCESDKKSVQPGDLVVLSGSILTYTCLDLNLPPEDQYYPYSEHSGDLAVFKIDNRYEMITDESSNFELSLIPGEHELIVYLRHAYPDTLTFTLTNDTAINFVTQIDYLNTESMSINFLYKLPDTLTMTEEIEFIKRLNEKLGSPLNENTLDRTATHPIYSRYSIDYNEKITPWTLYEAANDILHTDPEFIDISMSTDIGFYGCINYPPGNEITR